MPRLARGACESSDSPIHPYRLDVTTMAAYSTRKDRRETVTLDRVASRKARAARVARDDRRATTKSARRNAYRLDIA